MKIYWKGSFTVEAAIVVPMILFSFCALITWGIQLHEIVKESAENQDALHIETMKRIREQDIILEITGEENEGSI